MTTETGGLDLEATFERQTAVMDALPHAIHPIHDNWRTKADALILGLEQRGWTVAPVGERDRLRNELAACRDADDFDPNAMIHVYDEMRDERDKAYSESTRLRAQRRAVLDLCDARQRYVDEDEPDSLPVVWIKDVRAALGASS